MQDFESACARFLTLCEQDLKAPFVCERDALIEGRWTPLYAQFTLDTERKVFGIMPTGNSTHCHEYCVFLPVERPNEAVLDELLSYIRKVRDSRVKPDRTHEFSLVSLVLVTGGAPERAVTKPIKKLVEDVQYRDPQRGWSSVRVALVDLEGRKMVFNRAGTALADRMKDALQKL